MPGQTECRRRATRQAQKAKRERQSWPAPAAECPRARWRQTCEAGAGRTNTPLGRPALPAAGFPSVPAEPSVSALRPEQCERPTPARGWSLARGAGLQRWYTQQAAPPERRREGPTRRRGNLVDRKSTRLNSSHLVNSYAVFCLNTKKQ